MADTISPNMGLVIPGVGTEPSPTWATDLNSSLTIVDAHNHTPGSGVQIPPSGLNINSDLTFNNNNQTMLRSSRYAVQASPLAGALDLGCVYVSGVDLYFNDENGNQIQITKAGGIAGTSGSIANLTSPASASYVSGTSTFVWQSAANTAANMDNGSVTIRKLTASSPGITLAPPSSLSSNYTLTLPPAPPSVNSVLVMDNSGNVTTTAVPDSLTVTNGITSTSGNIVATVGNVDAGGDVNAAGSMTATGNVNASFVIAANNVNAGANVNAQLVNTSLGVNPGGSSNAQLTSGSVNQVNVVSSANSSSFGIATSALAPSLIIVGRVNGSGTAVMGSAFTSVRNGVGNYTVSYTVGATFTTTFPAVTCTIDQSISPTIAITCYITTSNQFAFTLQTVNSAAAAVDSGFSFIAVGVRI